MLNLIKALCAIPGISGREEPVRDYIQNFLTKHGENAGLSYEIDPLGSLIVRKGDRAGAIALYAHMDEVGLMITHATGEGLLAFQPIGIDPRVLFGRRVLVGEQALPGSIGGTAWHHLTAAEREGQLKVESMAIDIGAEDKEDALGHVLPGDFAVFDVPFTHLEDDRITARALDDRAGCALLMRLLTETDLSFTAVFTVQEESGLIGAAAAASRVAAPLAIVVETTTAGDLPDVPVTKQVCRVGGGPVVSFADRGAIYNRHMLDRAIEVAVGNGLEIQGKEGIFGGNDGREVQRAGGGAKTLAVSVPCRYLHSASCVADLGDIENTYELLRALVADLNP